MNVSKEQKENIEKVKKVFQDYIQKSRLLDLLWSEKLGYVLLTGISKEMDSVYMHPIVLRDAETLCYKLLYEIACDVLEEQGYSDDIWAASENNKNLLMKVFQPYIYQLPEYGYLVKKLFAEPEQESC